ncbi:MAG: S-layer homology domain-containing protein, partial [Clostridia bacterium]|nr:S-layer homology domain-containing protein [Clostridia bacterium]
MKKILSAILALCMMLTMATSAFAAYGEHEHQLMKMANMNSHYEECQVCFELFNVGEHTFNHGKCTVCGHYQLVNPYVDVPEDAWYHDEVVGAVYTGIINGKSATEFKPDDLLTYAEAIKLAACM